jgi:recombination protein RecA
MPDTPENLEARADQFERFVSGQQKATPGSVFRLDDDSARLDVEVIPTGAISLDVALGVGGLPRGRIIELYGPQMSGKSSLSLAVCRQAQEMGGYVGYIDAEHAFSREFAVDAFGIDESRFALAQPDSGEEGLKMVQRMAESGAFDVIVVDSVAALIPRAMSEAEIGEANQLGQHAKMMSDGLRKLTPIIDNSRAVVVFINQIRMNPGAYGNPETTTGGRALGFYASVRLEVRSSASKRITQGSEVVGQTCVVKITKNKVAPPYREATYDLFYDSGIASEGSLLEVAEKVGVLSRAGASYTEVATGERIAIGKDAAKKAIADDPDLAKRLTEAVYASLGHTEQAPVTEVGENADPGPDGQGSVDVDA